MQSEVASPPIASSGSQSMLLLLAAACAVALAGGIFMFKDTVIGFLNPQPKILIMDISRIVDAASIQFSQTPNADVNLALTKAAELSRAINEEASLLASKGYIVMSRQGVISSPTGVDITEQMALKMGVDLSKSKIKNGGTFGMAR